MSEQINWFKVRDVGIEPKRGKAGDAGFDLATPQAVYLAPGSVTVIPLGIGFEIPVGFYGKVADRSSMAARGLVVCGGVIDPTYRGEVSVVLFNTNPVVVTFDAGSRIAQIIFHAVYSGELQAIERAEASATVRGELGFGSSGE